VRDTSFLLANKVKRKKMRVATSIARFGLLLVCAALLVDGIRLRTDDDERELSKNPAEALEQVERRVVETFKLDQDLEDLGFEGSDAVTPLQQEAPNLPAVPVTDLEQDIGMPLQELSAPGQQQQQEQTQQSATQTNTEGEKNSGTAKKLNFLKSLLARAKQEHAAQAAATGGANQDQNAPGPLTADSLAIIAANTDTTASIPTSPAAEAAAANTPTAGGDVSSSSSSPSPSGLAGSLAKLLSGMTDLKELPAISPSLLSAGVKKGGSGSNNTSSSSNSNSTRHHQNHHHRHRHNSTRSNLNTNSSSISGNSSSAPSSSSSSSNWAPQVGPQNQCIGCKTIQPVYDSRNLNAAEGNEIVAFKAHKGIVIPGHVQGDKSKLLERGFVSPCMSDDFCGKNVARKIGADGQRLVVPRRLITPVEDVVPSSEESSSSAKKPIPAPTPAPTQPPAKAAPKKTGHTVEAKPKARAAPRKPAAPKGPLANIRYQSKMDPKNPGSYFPRLVGLTAAQELEHKKLEARFRATVGAAAAAIGATKEYARKQKIINTAIRAANKHLNRLGSTARAAAEAQFTSNLPPV